MKKLLGFATIGLALLLSACANDSFQKQAYVLGQSYAGAQEGAITYLKVASPSQDVKDKIYKADQTASPLVKGVLECAKSMLAPAPEEASAAALGVDAEEALEAKCQGKLATALVAIDSLRNILKEN